MKKLILCLSIASLYCTFAYSQSEKVDVPSGVVYKYCADSINTKAKEIIRKELSAESEYTICEKTLFCGPMLWKRYKDIPGVGEIEAGNMTLKVPKYDKKGKANGFEDLSGKLIQTREDFIIFWKQVLNDFEGTEVVIRKLNANELSYYWAIIFFDIEEPIYAVENSTHTFLFDMDENGILVWIEQLR